MGKLPWMERVNARGEDKLFDNQQESVERKIYEIKNQYCLWELDKDAKQKIPGEFIVFIQYCRTLTYDETPNYVYLCELLTNLFSMNKFSVDKIIYHK